MKRLLLALIVALLPATGFGQATILQGGPFAAGHVPMYSSPGGTQPIAIDSGKASGGGPGVGLSELNITARGAGTAPFVGLGTGPLGTVFSIQDAPSTNATGYHYLSFSANAAGGGLIAYGAGGTAAPLPLSLNINGTTYQFPFSLSGIVGPGTSVINDVACWNNTVGTLLKDCGGTIQLSGSVTGTTTLSAAATASGVLTLPNATDTLIGKATTDTLTNKTFDTAGTGNVLRFSGVAVTGVTGTGAGVLSASPTFTGVPLAPTAATGTSTTQLATTAFARTAVAGQVIRITTFATSSTYNANANLIYAIIECVGGGGGGGGQTGGVNLGFGGGGGGAGSYSRRIASAATIGVSQVVTIGAAGAAGASGSNAGGAGGDTSVGSLCVGKGAGGGFSGNNPQGGVGGVAGTGDITATGAPGGAGVLSNGAASGLAGHGGSTVFGAGGVSQSFFSANSVAGLAASGYGGGGGGGVSFNGTNVAGGAGFVGYVVITEFCSQ